MAIDARARRSRPLAHRARAVLGAAALTAVAFALAACSGDSPPARSPLGPDTTTPAAATGTVTPTASPLATATVTAAAPGGTPVTVDRELAIGKAIERMSQWLGVEQTDLVFDSFEEQAFANACLGIARPGLACAEVITPGVRVVLLDRTGAPHELRADAALQSFAWAPAATATGTVAAVNQSSGRLTVAAGGAELSLRRAPGTLQDVPFAELRVGTEISVGFDPATGSSEPDVLVWIAR